MLGQLRTSQSHADVVGKPAMSNLIMYFCLIKNRSFYLQESFGIILLFATNNSKTAHISQYIVT